MDKDEFGPMDLQRLEAGSDGALTGISTVHRSQQAKAFDRGPVKIVVVRVDHWLDDGNLPVSGESRKCRSDRGLTENFPILLGHVPARAQSTPSSYDYGCDLH